MEHMNKRKMSAKGESLYAHLTLPKTASADEIRKHYRRLALKYHPDKNPDPEATEKFKEITYAYSILSDENKRSIYDEYGSIGLAIGQSFGDEHIRIKLPWWLKIIVLAGCIATGFCCCCCCCCCCKYKYADPEEAECFQKFQQTALVEYAPTASDFSVDDEENDEVASTSNVKVTTNPFFGTDLNILSIMEPEFKSVVGKLSQLINKVAASSFPQCAHPGQMNPVFNELVIALSQPGLGQKLPKLHLSNQRTRNTYHKSTL